MSHCHLAGWADPPIRFQVSLQGHGRAESWAPSQETQIVFQVAFLPVRQVHCTTPQPPTPIHLTGMCVCVGGGGESDEPVDAKGLCELESQEDCCDSISILNRRKFLTV